MNPSPLDSQALNDRILSEQVALMCRLSAAPLLGSIVIGAIVAYTAVEDSGLRVSGAWYAASLAIMLMRWGVARAFLLRPREPAEVRRWLSVMFALIALFGLIWSFPPAFLLPKSAENEVIMSVMFIGATATGIGSLSAVRHAYTMLLIPLTLPYGISQFMMGGDRRLIGLAFLFYLPVMIVNANRQTRTVASQIRLAVQNENLAGALREANQELQAQLTQHRLSAEQIRSLNHDLELQASDLRTANQDLEGFSYSVSHDLRAPLRAIDGFSRLLEEHTLVDEAGASQHYVSRIRENVSRMAMLIDDLLAFSRFGRQPVDMGELRMEELVRTAVNEARSARPNEAPPEIMVDPLPAARGDQRLMLQVWINLIDNAVKYTSKVAGPRIVVRGREESNRIVFEVIDNGVGFDSRYTETLFGVFQRLHGAREYPGTGVGLAIVRRIVTRHGGEVWAKSELNQGATFGFALPKAAVVDTSKAAASVEAS